MPRCASAAVYLAMSTSFLIRQVVGVGLHPLRPFKQPLLARLASVSRCRSSAA